MLDAELARNQRTTLSRRIGRTGKRIRERKVPAPLIRY